MPAGEPVDDNQSANEEALRRAVDTTPAFIHTARPDGYLDYFNRGWLEFFGKSLEEVCGWRWTEMVHPEDVATLVQKWHAALASGEPLEVESRVSGADGSYRAFLHRKVPLRDEHGNIVKWFGSSIDIEDRKCAERKIEEKTSELEQREFYLREGERLAHMGSWSLGPDGTFDYWSPETFVLFCFDPSEGITDGNLKYEGSLTIAADLMEKCGLIPYERILCGNMANGNRFETYAIPGDPGSGQIVLNGAAAFQGKRDDVLTIMSFAHVPKHNVQHWKPRVIVLGKRNRIVNKRGI